MKTATSHPCKRSKRALAMLTGVMIAALSSAAPAYEYTDNGYSATRTNPTGYNQNQRDPAYLSNTVSDCVHGSTGIAANLDCSRNHASRHVNDTGVRTDTAEADGNMHDGMWGNGRAYDRRM